LSSKFLGSRIDETLLALGRASIHDLVPEDVLVPPGFTRAPGAIRDTGSRANGGSGSMRVPSTPLVVAT
jgi:hypothetical protein